MSADEGQTFVEEHYLSSFENILEQDYTDATEIILRTGKDEYEIDMMLDALSRTTPLEKTGYGDDGRLYDATEFNLDQHQDVIEVYNLL